MNLSAAHFFLTVCCLLLLPRAVGGGPPLVEIEKVIGQQVAGALRDSSGVDTDPLLTRWIERIGSDVAAASPRKDILPTFAVLGTDAANALAAPGGYIFVTRGLLDVVESDDELAVVLAHEVGHHTKKHAMQQIGAQVAFLFGSSFIRGENSGQIRTGLVILNVLRTLHKSREMEAQADELGIEYAAKTGYDPRGMVEFFKGFDQRKRNALEEYFATHPSPDRRIKAAERNPLVIRADGFLRDDIARAYENRGLRGAASAARAGRDPLALPPLNPPVLTATLQAEQESVYNKSRKVRQALGATVGAQKVGNVLQTLLLINNQADFRWLYIASRAFAVQTQVEDLVARTLRVAQTAPGTYDALAGYADSSTASLAGYTAVRESEQGRGEVQEALARIEGAPTPLLRASRAVATVLADLNNRFVRYSNTQAWLRYGALEALLRYAESELARADRMSGESWRILSLARIRRYQLRITELVPEDSIARRAIWYDLAQRRLGRAFDGSGAAGEVTVQTALAVQLGQSPQEVSEERGVTSWAEWVLEKNGIPENIATVTRMLALDLEREIAAQDKETAQRTADRNEERDANG